MLFIDMLNKDFFGNIFSVTINTQIITTYITL